MSIRLNGEYVNTEEAAAIIGVTDSRVRQMIIGGELAAVAVNERSWLILESEAQRVAKNRKRPGRPARSR